MKFQLRKIRLLSQSPKEVVFQHLVEGEIVTMSKYVFDQYMMAGAFEIVNFKSFVPPSNDRWSSNHQDSTNAWAQSPIKSAR